MNEFNPWTVLHKRAGVVVGQDEIAELLMVAALALSAVECPENAKGDCPGCNEFRKLFWELSNSLDVEIRTAYQHALAVRGIPLPDAPWEDIDAQGDPT